MSDFSKTQLRKLTGKLDRRHVQSREVDGRSVDYIEGWFAITQANAIFGFSGWDREMTHFERIYERSRGDVTSCAYVARVRIRVRTGRTIILREGSGCGSATANTSGEAHDMALKAAETDATKRALATFGNSFGLGLYDKEQNGVTAKKNAGSKSFVLYDPTGAPFAQNLSAEGFCSGLRQLIESASVPDELEALARCNKEGVSSLRSEAPNLKTAKHIHYADIVERLIKDRLASSLHPPSANGHDSPRPLDPTGLNPTSGNAIATAAAAAQAPAPCRFLGRCCETMAMKTMLSIPRTISSTTKVAKLIQAFGSVRSSSIGKRYQSQPGDRSGNNSRNESGESAYGEKPTSRYALTNV